MSGDGINSWTTDVFRGDWVQPCFDVDGNAYLNGKKLLWVCQNPGGLVLGRSAIGAFTLLNAKHGIEIQDFVQVASHCSIYSIATLWKGESGKVTIKRNARIGAYSMIMPGVTIGENAVIGAFSFVNRDVPGNCLAFGVPCRVQRLLSFREVSQLEGSVNNIEVKK